MIFINFLSPFLHAFFRVTNLFKKLIAPPFCVRCRSFLDDYSVLCHACVEYVKPVVSHRLTISGEHTLIIHAVSPYEEPLKSLILAKSYGDYAASIQLARLIWDHSAVKRISFDLIVPVPLHWTRSSWRGYNQADVIAQELARLSGKPVVPLVRRVKRTPFLSHVQAVDRQKTVSHVFELDGRYTDFEEKNMLLVDDVMTTGSTLKAVAKELIKMKPGQLHAAVASRVIS